VALREYRGYRPTAVTVRMGEEELSTDCYVLAFANASQYGNNAFIAPHADLKDGLLDLCLIDRLPPLRAARVGYGLAVGDLPASSAARYYTAAEAVVEAERPLGFHVDGEYAGEAESFTVALSPLALEIAT
jgi:diacylglycerol kinase family enzyme